MTGEAREPRGVDVRERGEEEGGVDTVGLEVAEFKLDAYAEAWECRGVTIELFDEGGEGKLSGAGDTTWEGEGREP